MVLLSVGYGIVVILALFADYQHFMLKVCFSAIKKAFFRYSEKSLSGAVDDCDKAMPTDEKHWLKNED
jgi:hypothetical protein